MLVLLRKKYDNLQIFVYGALLGGVVEYVVSWLQEFYTHNFVGLQRTVFEY